MDTELLTNLRLHLQNTPIDKLHEEWAAIEEIFYDVVNDRDKVNELNKAAVIGSFPTEQQIMDAVKMLFDSLETDDGKVNNMTKITFSAGAKFGRSVCREYMRE